MIKDNRPICVQCKTYPVTSRSKGNYRKVCDSCHKKKYRKFLRDKCEFCGFIPTHICQLDIDHKDGDKKNNKPDNLQTLCANCHRLKTQINKDYNNLH